MLFEQWQEYNNELDENELDQSGITDDMRKVTENSLRAEVGQIEKKV